MRTTIRLDDDLLKSAKRVAHDTGRTLTKLIEDALRHAISSRTTKKARRSVKLTTVSGRGVRPGVDVDDSVALLAFMERPHGSS